jgi:hypothetical protein
LPTPACGRVSSKALGSRFSGFINKLLMAQWHSTPIMLGTGVAFRGRQLGAHGARANCPDYTPARGSIASHLKTGPRDAPATPA